MKKQLLSFASVALVTTLFAQQTPIQNGGFETWASGAKAPTGWSTVESAADGAGLGMLLTGKKFSSKETTAGNYVEGVQAVSVQNDEVSIPGSGTQKIPGTLIYGTINVSLATQSFDPVGTAFAAAPDLIKFAYKYEPQGGDSASFFVRLTKFNSKVDSSVNLGGVFESLDSTGSANWDSVSAPIDYDPQFAGQTADTVLIGFLSGGMANTKGSKLWVDNVRFVYNTQSGIVELPVSTPTIKVYPNPVVSTLNLGLNNIEENSVISIYSLAGNQSISKQLLSNQVSVNELAAGRYLFTISHGNKITGTGNFNVIK
ncbi:MAG TPA: T9SS type A sorting domain-containing protein [Chitinophagales bacterium]|nr:T9SS type A sorting domain-containing protein [Chitinophagales bacterium]